MQTTSKHSSTLVGWWFSVLFALCAFSSWATALTSPFWNDEVLTATVLRLGSASRIWAALKAGADQQPPFFYWLSSLVIHSPRHTEFWMRAPAIAGFCVLLLTVFVFMFRARGPAAALVSAAVLISSGGLYYASEARPYGAMLGCIGVAAVLWQKRKRGDYSAVTLVALTLTLVAVSALHYFGLFVVMIFGLVEIFIAFRSRRPDWALLLSLSLAGIPLICAWSLLQTGATQYGGAFWARPSLRTLAGAYRFTLSLPTVGSRILFRFHGTDITPGFLGPVILLAIVVGLLLLRSRPSPAGKPAPRPVSPELDLALGLFLLPLLAGIAGMVLGVFTPRYAIGSLIGAAMIFGWAMASLDQRFAYALAALLTLFFVWHQSVQDIVRMAAFSAGEGPSVIAQQEFAPIFRLAQAGDSIVISDGHLFLEAEYYADPAIRARLLYLQDHKLAVQFAGTDSVESTNDGVQRYLNLRLETPAAFLKDHPDFKMASRTGSIGWLPAYLMHEGAQLETIESNARGLTISRVRIPSSSSRLSG